MAITPTNNLGLSKPDRDENFNVANIYNKNLDTIDAFAGEVEGFIENSGLVAFGQYWSNEQAFSATREPMKCPTLRHSGGNFDEYFTVSSDGGTFTCIKECIALVSAYVGFSTVPTGTAVLDVAINNEEFQRNQAATNAWSPFQYDFSVGDTIKFEVVLSTAWTANRGNHVDFVVLNEKIDEPLDLDYLPIGTNKSRLLNVNLNTVTTIGGYYINPGDTANITNCPIQNERVSLVVEDWGAGTGAKAQTVWSYQTNKAYRRTTINNGAAWTAWEDISGSEISDNFYAIGNNRDIIANTADLNILHNILGSYASISDPAGRAVNGPIGSYYGFNLTTLKATGNTGWYTQEFLDRATNTLYRRSSSGSTTIRPWGQEGYASGRLYANSDLNNITEPGRYTLGSVSDRSTILNLPEEPSSAFVIEVEPYLYSATYAYIIQKYRGTLDSIGAEYYRYSANSGASWSTWRKVADSGEKYKLENRTALATGNDLDTYITPGSYVAPTDAISRSLINTPIGLYNGGILTVFRALSQTSTNYVTQEYRDYLGKSWTRTTANGGTSWSQWVEQSYQSSNSTLLTDFNSIITPGRYLVASTAENKPPVGTNSTILTVESRSNHGTGNIQILHQEAKYLSVKYARQSINGGTTWTDWVLVQDNLSNRYSLSLENKIEIPSDVDLDEYSTPGQYYTSSDAVSRSLSNKPLGVYHAFILNVYQQVVTANTYLIQEIADRFGTSWVRQYSTSTGWTSWFKPGFVNSIIGTSGSINVINEPGTYFVYAAQTDTPIESDGELIVTSHNAAQNAVRLRQEFLPVGTNDRYSRFSSNAGTTWSAWEKQVTREEYSALLARVEALEASKSLQLGAKNNIPANADINTYNQAGTYGITAANAASISNLPAGTGQATLIVNSPLDGGSGNVCDQLLLTTTTSSSIGAYIRQGNTSGNSWSDWVQFGASS